MNLPVRFAARRVSATMAFAETTALNCNASRCYHRNQGDVDMDTQQIVDAFRRLPIAERARLVEELWEDVARELEKRPLSEAERRFLDERLRQHDETPTDVEDWETARDDILGDL
jgi:putative addiction module component (TIGR02574 family)